MHAKRKRLSLVVACFAALTLATLPFSSQSASSQQGALSRQLLGEFKSATFFWRQLEIAKRIVALRDRSVLPKLAGWLEHDDRHVRGNAAFIFASLGDQRGFEVIQSILTDESDRSDGQGWGLVGGLQPSGLESEAIKRLNRQIRLKAQIKSDRYYAVALLGELKDQRAVPILIPLLTDNDVNSAVPSSLAKIGDIRAVGPLIHTLSDNDPDMRVLAIDALRKLRAKDAVPALYRLLSDTEKCHFDRLISVGEAAREALTDLETPH
jgi:HEAT repeat protein